MSRRKHASGQLLPIASSGGVTQLHRVIDMIDTGHDLTEIKAWCGKELRRLHALVNA